MSCDRSLRFSASTGGKPRSANTLPPAGVTCDTASVTLVRTAPGARLGPRALTALPARRFTGLEGLTFDFAPVPESDIGAARGRCREASS